VTAKQVKDRRAAIEAALPDDLREVFIRSVDDPAQLSLKLEIGLMDANLHRVMKMMEGMPTPEGWRKLQMLGIRLDRALEGRNWAAAKRCCEDLKTLSEIGNTNTEIWQEMQTSMVQRAKIGEAETRRLVASKTVVTVAEAELIVVTLFRIMQQEIAAEALKRVKERFVEAMHVNEPRSLEAGSDDDDIEEGELSNDE